MAQEISPDLGELQNAAVRLPPALPADRQRIVGPATFMWPVRSVPVGVPRRHRVQHSTVRRRPISRECQPSGKPRVSDQLRQRCLRGLIERALRSGESKSPCHSDAVWGGNWSIYWEPGGTQRPGNEDDSRADVRCREDNYLSNILTAQRSGVWQLADPNADQRRNWPLAA